MENKVTSHLTKGLIISLVLIVISLIAQFTGNEQATWVSVVSYVLLFAGIIWACISYGKQMNNAVTFGNVFAHGFKTSAVIAVMVIIFTVIFFLIFPDIKDKAMVLAREKMEEQGNLSDDQIDTALNMTQKFFLPITIGSIMFVYLLVGLIASLIGAGITKKDPPTPFANQA
jgi:hypothetical protein